MIRKRIKRVILYVLVAPMIFAHRLRGVKYSNEEFANLFRYIPTAQIKGSSVFFLYKFKILQLNFGYLSPMVAAIFGNNEYSSLNVKGKDVIDIGASICDTAIYFMINGAKSVDAYELNYRNYLLGLENLNINSIKNVELNYCGVSSKKILPEDEVLGAIMTQEDYKLVERANFMTLEDIVSAKNDSNLILKVDVDGYEYDIFESVTNETLRKCSEIFIEYHFGEKNLVKKLLDCGFSVNSKKINYIYANHHPVNFREMNIGYIHASRID